MYTTKKKEPASINDSVNENVADSSTDNVVKALETLSLNLPQSQAADNSNSPSMRDSDEKILLGFHGTAPKHIESLMRGIRISGDFTGTAGGTRHGTGFYIASDYGTADGYAFAASGHDMSAERAVFAVYAPNEDTLRNMTIVDYIQLYRGRSNGRGRPTSYEAIFTRQNEVDNLILERVLDEDSPPATTRVDPGIFRNARGPRIPPQTDH
ncbi:hypothetical protein ACR9GP_22675 [Enterobacter ludwigii]